MDLVDELVIKPFRDVVEKGKMTMENGANEPAMMREGQRLVKGGERCLTRIETSCRKLYNDYGDNFVNALKDNDEITEYRKQLTELLWDFEDFVEPHTFEAEKFHELQALHREAAPKVYNLLITMKIQPPTLSLSSLSPPSSPHPQPLSPGKLSSRLSVGWASLGGPGDARSTYGPQDAQGPHVIGEATNQIDNLMSDLHLASPQSPFKHNSSPVVGYAAEAAHLSERQPLPPSPRPSSSGPRESQPVLYIDDQSAHGPGHIDWRRTIFMPESPVDPALAPFDPDNHMCSPSLQSFGSVTTSDPSDYHDHSDYRYSGSSSHSNSICTASRESRPRAPTSSQTIPEDGPTKELSQPAGDIQPLQVRPPRASSLRPPLGSRHDTDRVDDMGRQYDAKRPLQARVTNMPLPQLPRQYQQDGSHTNARHSDAGGIKPENQPGLEAVPLVPDREGTGLIPVETEEEAVGASGASCQGDCSIRSDSSFLQCKGFCEGAQQVRRGDVGVKKMRKPGFASYSTVARCTGCLFELDFSQIEYDVNKEDRGTYHKSGINYRLRFLQKSHVPAKRADDVLYACVFCVQAGRTITECDATVFTSSKALLNHLSYHSRPLPKVPGFAVVEGDSVPDFLRNDYDIHFTSATRAHPVQLNASQISGKATGVAREHCRRLYGQRLLFDSSPALDICQGGRVAGIDWPEKYHGEWIFAWHDGLCASVPTDAIKLSAPPAEDIRMASSTRIRAKSRWKFQQKEQDKDKSLWLKFDKNEVITNISYCKREFWCWSGTNSKGKWGIFPQVFLDPCTVQELTAEGADHSLSLGSEKSKPSSRLAILSSKRRRNERPPSVADSASSHETLSGHYSSRFSRSS